MNDGKRKVLTEYLGECWRPTRCPFGCERQWALDRQPRTFNNWIDFGLLVEKVKERGELEAFSSFAFDKVWGEEMEYPKEIGSDFVDWLIDKDRLPELVYDWLSRRG